MAAKNLKVKAKGGEQAAQVAASTGEELAGAQVTLTATTCPVIGFDLGYTRQISETEYLKPRFMAIVPVKPDGTPMLKPEELKPAMDELVGWLETEMGNYVLKATGQTPDEKADVPWDGDDGSVNGVAAEKPQSADLANEVGDIFDDEKQEEKESAFETEDEDGEPDILDAGESPDEMPIGAAEDDDDPLGLGLD